MEKVNKLVIPLPVLRKLSNMEEFKDMTVSVLFKFIRVSYYCHEATGIHIIGITDGGANNGQVH